MPVYSAAQYLSKGSLFDALQMPRWVYFPKCICSCDDIKLHIVTFYVVKAHLHIVVCSAQSGVY